MKTRILSTLSALALALGMGTTASAQFVEEFSGITAFGTGTVTGTPTMGPFDSFVIFDFGAPQPTVVNDAATAFPYAADDIYLTYTSNGDNGYAIRSAANATLANTAGVLQAAFAIRVNSLDANAANNRAWLFRADTENLAAVDVGIRVDGGDIILEGDNGWTETPFDTTAFKQGAGTWEGTGWRVMAVRAERSTTAGAGAIKIWEIDTATGVATEMHSQSGVTNDRAGEIGRYWFAGWDTAVLPGAAYANVSVSYDKVAIYPNDTVASEAAFLSAVAQDFSAATNVESWDLY